MKSIVKNLDEAIELVIQISQFDSDSVEAIICIIIDKESAKYKEPAISILARIGGAVEAVNEAMGPYIPDIQGGRS